MKVLITAPNLNTEENVSGIASVVTTIIKNNLDVQYIHFIAGRTDKKISAIHRIFELFKSYIQLLKILSNNEINVVHLNLPLNSKSLYRDFLFFIINKLYKKKIVTHLHGGNYLLKKPSNIILNFIIRFILHHSDTLISLSKFEKETVEILYQAENIQVLENTVDDEYLKLEPANVLNGKLNILFLGRLHESKGIKIILSAIKLLSEKGHNVNIIFCGTGPLKELVVSESLLFPNHIQYLGIVKGNEKLKIITETQIFLLPSLYGEGLPMALMETMASGLVPIVTPDGSMKYLIEDGINGFLIKKGDVNDLVRKIEFLLENHIKIKEISINAKSFIVDNYSIKQYVKLLNAVYYNIFKSS